MIAALVVAAVALALAPVFVTRTVTRTVTRGAHAARYTALDLARDAVTAWRETRPVAAFERTTRKARRQRRRALPDTVIAIHTPASIDLRSAA